MTNVTIFNGERGVIDIRKNKGHIHCTKNNSSIEYIYDLNKRAWTKIRHYKHHKDTKEKVNISEHTQWFYKCALNIKDDMQLAKLMIFAIGTRYLDKLTSIVHIFSRFTQGTVKKYKEWYQWGFKIKEIERYFEKDINLHDTISSCPYHRISIPYAPNEISFTALRLLRNIQEEKGYITTGQIQLFQKHFANGEYKIYMQLLEENDKIENENLFYVNDYHVGHNIIEEYGKDYISTNRVNKLMKIIMEYNLDIASLLNWLRYQFHVEKNKITYILDTYPDYLRMEYKLKERYSKMEKYPKNFRTKEHQVMAEYNAKKEEINETEFKANSDKFKRYEYQDDKYKVIVPSTPKMIEDEANQQEHCVRSYIKDMQHGKTCICFIRYLDNLSQSLLTVEVKKDTIVQVRGEHNRKPTEDENTFVDKWAREKQLQESYYRGDG